MTPLEALNRCIEAALFIEPLKRSGPGQAVLTMINNSPEIANALKQLSSADIENLRPDACFWH